MDKIAEKAVLIGIDSITPELTERFIDEEKLPNWQGLVEDGVFGEGIPPLPSLTGSNWKTIVTGAYPGTIGVTGCWFHISGTPLDQLVNGFISNFTKAECLWTTAERHKLKPLIMKYAGALGTAKKPFAVERGIQVEGFASPMWGGNWFEICPCLLYSTESYRDAVQVQFQKTSDWKNLPESTRTPLETTIKVKPKRGEAEVKFNLLIIDSKGDGYDRVVISPSRNIKEAIGNVGVGEWTDWLTEKFEGRILQGPPVRAHQVPNSGFRWDYDPEYTRQYKEIEGTFRFKLIELSPDGKRLRLYRSQVFPKSGFTKPDSLAEKLVEKFGPFQEHIGPKPIYEGWIDEETFLEEMDYQSRWLGKATDYIFSHYDLHL
jgi:hypothetical protein